MSLIYGRSIRIFSSIGGDENFQRKGIKSEPVEPEEEQNVLGTPFTTSEARNLLRLGWIALEFLRDDRRPCCIVEVSKSNVTLKNPTNPPKRGHTLRKTDLDTGITTMVDASDPGTISQLMRSVEGQFMEGGISMPKTLPRIMFENQAFLSANRDPRHLGRDSEYQRLSAGPMDETG